MGRCLLGGFLRNDDGLLDFLILLILLSSLYQGSCAGCEGMTGEMGVGMDECTNVWIHVNSLVDIDDFELTWVAIATSSHMILQNLMLFVLACKEPCLRMCNNDSTTYTEYI